MSSLRDNRHVVAAKEEKVKAIQAGDAEIFIVNKQQARGGRENENQACG